MNKTDITKININKLNDKARKIFEGSDTLALVDLFGNCQSIDEINEAAIELYDELMEE